MNIRLEVGDTRSPQPPIQFLPNNSPPEFIAIHMAAAATETSLSGSFPHLRHPRVCAHGHYQQAINYHDIRQVHQSNATAPTFSTCNNLFRSVFMFTEELRDHKVVNYNK